MSYQLIQLYDTGMQTIILIPISNREVSSFLDHIIHEF